jgi:polyisoprenoid-binding protein YceI
MSGVGPEYRVDGELTIGDITRPIELDLQLLEPDS